MLSTEHGETGTIDAVPYARVKIPDTVEETEGGERVVQTEDWRAPELPYVVPDDLRLPWEQLTGRPSVGPPCTEDTARRLEQLIINGVSVLAAKTMIGIQKQRWLEWMSKAKQGDAPYSTLAARISMATAHVEATANVVIRRGAVHPDPKIAIAAAKTTLEHVNPRKYAPKTVPTSSNSVTNNVQVNVNGLDALRTMGPEQIRALGELFAGKTAPEPATSDRWLAVPTADSAPDED